MKYLPAMIQLRQNHRTRCRIGQGCVARAIDLNGSWTNLDDLVMVVMLALGFDSVPNSDGET